GQLNLLRSEMQAQPIGCLTAPGQTLAKGSLRNLLRPRTLLGDDECYRIDVVSDLRGDISAETSLIPPLVVFDGARGYLRHRTRWRKSSWIIVFDLAGRLVDDGIRAL